MVSQGDPSGNGKLKTLIDGLVDDLTLWPINSRDSFTFYLAASVQKEVEDVQKRSAAPPEETLSLPRDGVTQGEAMSHFAEVNGYLGKVGYIYTPRQFPERESIFIQKKFNEFCVVKLRADAENFAKRFESLSPGSFPCYLAARMQEFVVGLEAMNEPEAKIAPEGAEAYVRRCRVEAQKVAGMLLSATNYANSPQGQADFWRGQADALQDQADALRGGDRGQADALQDQAKASNGHADVFQHQADALQGLSFISDSFMVDMRDEFAQYQSRIAKNGWCSKRAWTRTSPLAPVPAASQKGELKAVEDDRLISRSRGDRVPDVGGTVQVGAELATAANLRTRQLVSSSTSAGNAVGTGGVVYRQVAGTGARPASPRP